MLVSPFLMVNIGQRLCFLLWHLMPPLKTQSDARFFSKIPVVTLASWPLKKTMFPSIDEQLSVGA
jgi:hypothetical protein